MHTNLSIGFLIPFDLIHRFQFMEIYMKQKYTKSYSFHEMFKRANTCDKIVAELKKKTRIDEEKDDYTKEIMKHFGIEEFDNVAKSFSSV